MPTKPAVADYIAALKEAEAIENPAAEIERFATELFEQLGQGVSERTLANKLTPYNKAVLEAFPAETLKDGTNAYISTKADKSTVIRHLHFKFTTSQIDFETHNKKSSSKMDHRMDNPARVHADKFLDCVVDALNSEDDYELSAGLIAASGRRAIEIWRLGEFAKTEDPYTVKFKGQAKRRDYGIPKDELPEYEIRLLVPAKEFLRVWWAFKKTEAYKTCKTELARLERTLDESALRAQFHSMRGKSIDRAVKRIFEGSGALEGLDSIGEGHQVSSHILRHAAVNLLAVRDVQSNAIGKQLKFAAEQLGHYISGEDKISDVLATVGYINFEVLGEVTTLDDEFKTASVRINHTDLERFNELGKRLNARHQKQTFYWLLGQADRVIELEKELAELRRQLAAEKPKAEAQAMPTEPAAEVITQDGTMNPQSVEALIDSKIEALESRLLAALGQVKPAAEPVAPEPAEVAPESLVQASEPQIMPAAETELKTPGVVLKRAKSERGEAAERRTAEAFWAIADHNDKQLKDSDKWFVSARLIKDLAGGNYGPIKRWFDENETTVTEHNERHELGESHNRIHHRGESIKDAVKL